MALDRRYCLLQVLLPARLVVRRLWQHPGSLARIALIYKNKGPATDMGNCCPIALPSSYDPSVDRGALRRRAAEIGRRRLGTQPLSPRVVEDGEEAGEVEVEEKKKDRGGRNPFGFLAIPEES